MNSGEKVEMTREKICSKKKRKKQRCSETGEWLGAFTGFHMKKAGLRSLQQPNWRHSTKHDSDGFVVLCKMLCILYFSKKRMSEGVFYLFMLMELVF